VYLSGEELDLSKREPLQTVSGQPIWTGAFLSFLGSRSERLEFYSTLLSQYTAYNGQAARRPVDLQFLVDRIVACVQGPSPWGIPPAAPPSAATVSPSACVPLSPELADSLNRKQSFHPHFSPDFLDSVSADCLSSLETRDSSCSLPFASAASSPFSASSRASSRRASVLAPSASPDAETPQSLPVSSFPVAEEIPRRRAAAAAPEQEGPAPPRVAPAALRDWEKVAAALPLVHVFCRAKLPSCEVSLLEQPHCIPCVSPDLSPELSREQRRPKGSNPQGAAPPDSEDLDAAAFSSALASYEDNARRRQRQGGGAALSGRSFEPCIVSFTSVGGEQSLTPIPQQRGAPDALRKGPSASGERREPQPAIFSLTIPQQTLFLSLGMGKHLATAGEEKTRAADAETPQLVFAFSPFFHASTSSVVTFFSSFSILSALVKEKLALLQLLRVLLSPRVFEQAPFRLLDLLRRQVLLPASAASSFASPLQAVSPGARAALASRAGAGMASEGAFSRRSVSLWAPSEETGPAGSRPTRPKLAGSSRTSADAPGVSGTPQATDGRAESLGGGAHAAEKVEDTDSASDACKAQEAFWMRFLENSFTRAVILQSPGGMDRRDSDGGEGRSVDTEGTADESVAKEDCMRGNSSAQDGRTGHRDAGRCGGVERRRPPRGEEKEDKKNSRLTCPVPQVRLDDDGGCPSEDFLSYSEAECSDIDMQGAEPRGGGDGDADLPAESRGETQTEFTGEQDLQAPSEGSAGEGEAFEKREETRADSTEATLAAEPVNGSTGVEEELENKGEETRPVLEPEDKQEIQSVDGRKDEHKKKEKSGEISDGLSQKDPHLPSVPYLENTIPFPSSFSFSSSSSSTSSSSFSSSSSSTSSSSFSSSSSSYPLSGEKETTSASSETETGEARRLQPSSPLHASASGGVSPPGAFRWEEASTETASRVPSEARDEELVRGIRGVNAGRKSHPFKLFNG
ncbi:hypothetical protein TGFOU_211150D, partial [Toxoplasma gondii FOU]